MLHLTKWVGEQPYFIARDSARRAIVVSIRGTMSIQDCITDCMYKPVLLNADTIGMPQYTGCQLHCHAGVVTATNFILSDLEKHGILHRILLGDACSHGSKGKQKDWDTDVIFRQSSLRCAKVSPDYHAHVHSFLAGIGNILER